MFFFLKFPYVFMKIIFNIKIAMNHSNCGTRFPFQCQCELPESYEAYRKQQHRWHSGPMQLFRLCFMDIIKSKVLHLISVFSCKYTWLSFSCHWELLLHSVQLIKAHRQDEYFPESTSRIYVCKFSSLNYTVM
jgi:hypothetical protein